MHSTRRSILAAAPATVVLAGCLAEDDDADGGDDDGDGADGGSAGDGNGGDSNGDGDDSTGDPDDGSTDGEDGDPDADETVEVGSNAFDPDFLAVDPGATVAWRLVEGDHTVTLYHEDNDTQHRAPDGVEAFDDSLSDERFETTFETEGVYDYFCRPHEGLGMVGTVVVGGPDPDEPGLSTPAEDLPEDARAALADRNEETRAEFGLDDGDDDAGGNGESDDESGGGNGDGGIGYSASGL